MFILAPNTFFFFEIAPSINNKIIHESNYINPICKLEGQVKHDPFSSITILLLPCKTLTQEALHEQNSPQESTRSLNYFQMLANFENNFPLKFVLYQWDSLIFQVDKNKQSCPIHIKLNWKVINLWHVKKLHINGQLWVSNLNKKMQEDQEWKWVILNPSTEYVSSSTL